MSTVTDTLTVDELTLLLNLNGNKQLPHLETDIFANAAFVAVYLERLTIYRFAVMGYDPDNLYGNDWYERDQQGWAAMYYAIDILKQRWKIAETIISRTTYWADYFAEFPEA